MSVKDLNCILCGRKSQLDENDINIKKLLNCEYCGKFYEMDSLKQFLYKCNSDEYKESFNISNLYKVSSWIREQNDEFNIHPEIDTEKFVKILNMRDKKIKEKFDLMMEYLSSCKINFQLDNKVLVKCFIKDENEFEKLYQYALEKKFIEGALSKILNDFIYPIFRGLTFDGMQYIEELEEPNKNSKNIFVAFNFAPDIIEIFENFVKPSIEELGFTYTIVNHETTPHDQKITDEIVAKLKSSRLIIADFTNNSTNVYFESGFAMGMRIPVIWTCKKGHKFSFDTGQFPHITWENGEDLKAQLVNRIQVII